MDRNLMMESRINPKKMLLFRGEILNVGFRSKVLSMATLSNKLTITLLPQLNTDNCNSFTNTQCLGFNLYLFLLTPPNIWILVSLLKQRLRKKKDKNNNKDYIKESSIKVWNIDLNWDSRMWDSGCINHSRSNQIHQSRRCSTV